MSELFIEGSDENTQNKKPAENKNEIFRRSSKQRRKRKTVTIICIVGAVLLAAAIFLCFKLGIFGERPYDRTNEFYFTSDRLSEEGSKMVSNGAIEFELYNYADALRTSKYDIESFDCEIVCDGKNISKKCNVTSDKTSIPAGKRDSASVSIEIPEEYIQKQVEVRVTSAPTKITLRGTFTVYPKNTFTFESEKGSVVATLVLYANENGVFEVKWDTDKLVADPTDEHISSENKDTCKISVKAGGSYELRFFKTDESKEYTTTSKKLPVTVTFKAKGGK